MPSFTLPAAAHPVIRDAHEYWQSRHPQRGGLPGRQHLDPCDIPQLLPHIWLVDVQHRPLRLRYRLVGSAVDLGMGRTLTGRWLDEVNPGFFETPQMSGAYLGVIESKTPSYRKGAPIFSHNQKCSQVERLIMPLATDGQQVDMLFCATIFYLADGKILGSSL